MNTKHKRIEDIADFLKTQANIADFRKAFFAVYSTLNTYLLRDSSCCGYNEDVDSGLFFLKSFIEILED